MGKGTDKLYITHSEWASEDAYSASFGAGVTKRKVDVDAAAFRRLPFNFCSLSLQPFEHPVCTAEGTIYDLTVIMPWLKKHGTNPVSGQPLKSSDLIKLKFSKNEEGEFVDPVTFKPFTNNTHLVAIKTSGNVFAWDTVEKLNIRPKMWRDLVTDEEFGRKDILTLQDPQNIESRNLNSFKFLKDGETGLTEEQQKEKSQQVNLDAMGSSSKILKAREAVAKSRADRQQKADSVAVAKADGLNGSIAQVASRLPAHTSGKPTPYNAAKHTTGKAAASFTSTGLTPHTSADLALLTEEQYMLRRGRVKIKGYVQVTTTAGDLNFELHTEYAPKAVWNFIQLAKKGYYDSVTFHRNIKGFMIQGGDPTGTGRGGESVWKKNFEDEIDNPLKHDSRGVLSMANKGKNTNSSQFFVTYRAVPHLDRKHTIFGHLIDDPSPSSKTLSTLELAPVDSSSNRPNPPIRIIDVKVFVDPFEEFQNQRKANEEAEQLKKDTAFEVHEDDQVTWTGKRIRKDGADTATGSDRPSGVGKYLQAAVPVEDEVVEYLDDEPELEAEHVRKKLKSRGNGFGNFDNW